VVCRESIDRSLLDAATRAAHRHTCDDLDHLPVLGRHHGLVGQQRRGAVIDAARAGALSADAADRVDADAVATWIVDHYPAPAYPAVVLGSPHGGAVHLAAALGAPWLPTGFTVTVQWPDGAVDDWGGALRYGAAVAARLIAANPDVTVRQVHDPLRGGPVCGATLTLHVRWRRLPAAYRSFLHTRLRPGAAALVLRDTRTWPVMEVDRGHTFQVGSPVSGWEAADYTQANPSFRTLLRGLGGSHWIAPDFGLPRRYAEHSGEPELEPDLRQAMAGTGRPTHRVLYPNPEALSACVADLYREWLRAGHGGGDRCIVETERLIDPWQVLAAGLVPYWCESASRRTVAAAEWWLAGSRRFDSLDVLPAPPGSACDAHAVLGQWRAIASFGRSHGRVDREAVRRYPLLPLPTSHAAQVLRTQPGRRSAPPSVRVADLLSGMRRTGEPLGVLVL
jgi:hypothetical protein